MEQNKLQKANSIKIVGRLVDAQVTTDRRQSDGQAYVSVVATIQSQINGETNEYEVLFYSLEKTLEGKVSQLYTSYSKMGELVNKKVEVTGSLRENRYWSSNSNQIVSAQQLSGRFIKGVVESTQDEATFIISGFLVTRLTEKRNKNDEVYRYDLSVGQANYKGDNMDKFVLHVDPNNREAISFLDSCEIGSTFQFNGVLNFLVQKVTRTDDNAGGFGESVTRTYTNRQKNFWVKGSTAPIVEEEKGAYPEAVIKQLIAAYKAKDVELADKGSKGNDQPSDNSINNKPVTKRQASLI